MSEVPESEALKQMDAALADASMVGQWKFDALLEQAIGGPRPAGTAHLWAWDKISDLLLQSCEALPDGRTARRTLAFSNPGLQSGTTHTLLAAVQMILPGEVAWAHRHAISALRFCIEGSQDLYTVVDGERLPMERFDLILTPAWGWHDHHNDSEQRGIWLDVLDLPLVASMRQIAYGTLGEKSQPVRNAAQAPVSFMRPAWDDAAASTGTLRYPWKDVEAELSRYAEAAGSPTDGVMLEYTDPRTGGPVLPTIGCNVQMLRPGLATVEHRKTSSAICFVMEGSGTTTVEGQTFSWGPHDIFAIPSWSWHSHVNRSPGERAVLFVTDDKPLLKAMKLYRTETRDLQGGDR